MSRPMSRPRKAWERKRLEPLFASGASVEDEMWKVEGIDEEEDGLELGSIEEDPSLAVQGAGLRAV